MNINLPYILQNGMKILNIVNKTLPLVKEFNPAMSFITKKLKSVNNPTTGSFKQLKNSPVSKNTGVSNPIQNNNNTLTFFR